MTIQTWDEARGVRTLTDEEFIEEFGERRYREFIGPPPSDPETITEGRRALLDRMQAEQDLHDALALSGKTLDDLPVADAAREAG